MRYFAASLLLCFACITSEAIARDFSRADNLIADTPLFEHVTEAGVVNPNWIERSDTFWYARDDEGKRSFLLVDPDRNTVRSLFDNFKIAAAITTASGRKAGTDLDVVKVTSHGKAVADEIEVLSDGKRWACRVSVNTCQAAPPDRIGTGDLVSPDGRWAAYMDGNDLAVRSLESGAVHRLTDGLSIDVGLRNPQELGGPSDLLATSSIEPPVVWSRDSRHLAGKLFDFSKVPILSIIQSSPADAGLPKTFYYRKTFAFDPDIGRVRTVIFDVKNGEIWRSPDRTAMDEQPPVWSENSRTVYWTEQERGGLEVRLMAVDLSHLQSHKIWEDRGSTPTNLGPDAGIEPAVFAEVNRGAQLLVWSERDGWGHLYLVNSADGTLLRQVTKGPWSVHRILGIDDARRAVFFVAGDHRAGHDPYQGLVYRVSIDHPGVPVLLTPEDADHFAWTKEALSPSGRYFIDTYSRPDTPPTSLLRDASGHRKMVLAESDVQPLKAIGWRAPEPFHVKAADGATDIYGLLYKPADFDSRRHYAVIDCDYQGPYTFSVAKGFHLDRCRDTQAIAELGFLVVTVDGRGTSYRSKAFRDFAFGSIGMRGVVDHVAAIKTLAISRPYLDLNRVGMYGNSSGGDATIRAMIDFPGFVKVGVASGISGASFRTHEASYDETWLGAEAQLALWDNGPYANKIQGHLLLLHGELDDHANPAFMLRFLARAKDVGAPVDMLLMPNINHSIENLVSDNLLDRQFLHARWQYLLDHLGGPT